MTFAWHPISTLPSTGLAVIWTRESTWPEIVEIDGTVGEDWTHWQFVPEYEQ